MNRSKLCFIAFYKETSLQQFLKNRLRNPDIYYANLVRPVREPSKFNKQRPSDEDEESLALKKFVEASLAKLLVRIPFLGKEHELFQIDGKKTWGANASYQFVDPSDKRSKKTVQDVFGTCPRGVATIRIRANKYKVEYVPLAAITVVLRVLRQKRTIFSTLL